MFTSLRLFGFVLLFTSLAHAGDNPDFVSRGTQHGIVISVIDSGADYNHDRIAPQLFVDGEGVHGHDYKDGDDRPYDFIPPAPPAPKCSQLNAKCITEKLFFGVGRLIHLLRPGAAGHGTHVSGIALRVSDGARLLPVRIDYSSPEWVQQVVKAVEFAAAHGARVVNMSFGTYPDKMSPEEKAGMRALKRLIRSHPEMLFAIAAGNENTDMIREKHCIYPASLALPNIIVVGAVDDKGVLASFSNVGDGAVDVYAPGVEIESSWPGNTLHKASGTSMATPFIVGVAARLLARDEKLTGEELKHKVLALGHDMKLKFEKKGEDEKVTVTREFSGRVILEGDLP